MMPFLLGILSGVMIIGGVIIAFLSVLGNSEGKFVLGIMLILSALLMPLAFL